MRTAEIKIGAETRTAVLAAGGAGFKIYTVTGLNAWILALKKKIHVIEEAAPAFKTVSRYVNLNYQPADQQEIIKDEFHSLIRSLTPPSRKRDLGVDVPSPV